MNITIGRAEDNTLVIDDPEVSRYQAVLTRGDRDVLVLEDMISTNGSYVNDEHIRIRNVYPNDVIKFGTNYTATISDILHGLNDYSEDFFILKDVYDTYTKEKIRIQSKNQFKTRLFQTLPFALFGVFGVLLGLLGHVSRHLTVISIIVAVCAPTLGIYLGARQAAKIPALLQNLANQFKIDYVCPKCGTFLGEIPWESLNNKKHCPVSSCKANWIRT